MGRLRLFAVLLIGALCFLSSAAYAQYSSTNYKSNEVFFGTGGDNSQDSSAYSASVSAGSLGVGNGSSANFQAYSGFLTPNEPFLSMVINTPTVNLGTLSTSTTATGLATFQVTAYVDSGYTVVTMSQPPSYTSGAGSHTLSGMALGGSSFGTEQFGMNLVANTSPATFGAAPASQPAGFATGQASAGYNSSNNYKYSAGDTIACSGSSGSCTGSGWGAILYTISYIANISPFTPAGSYSVNQDLVVVATF